MKKLVGVTLAGLAVLFIVLFAQGKTGFTSPAAVVVPPTPEKKACVHLKELCTTSEQQVDVDVCEKKLEDTRKMSGTPSLERSEKCIEESQTCTAAAGCMAGGAGMGTMGEFLKGFGNALSH